MTVAFEEKKGKSQVKSVFWVLITKFQILSVQIYKIPYFPKPSNGEKKLKII